MTQPQAMRRPGKTKLPDKRRRRDVRHSGTTLVGLILGYGLELPVHLDDLGISFSVGF